MSRKVNKNLIALGSAAIVGVYALGYAHTQPASNHAAATVPAGTVTAVQSSRPAPATAIARAVAAATAPAAQANAGSTAAAAVDRDGTYSGTGTSRRGDITAEVTIQGGQITSARITRATTYYPVSRIARLPGEVVDRQSAQVDYVSGATDSSRAFRQAVSAALSQASTQSAPPLPAGR